VSSFDASSVELARRIISDGSPIGTVRIRSDVQAAYERIGHYALIVAGVLVLSLAARCWSRRCRSGPSRFPWPRWPRSRPGLSGEGLRHSRGRRGSTYELAVLVDSFNAMLTEIQQRDRSLQDAHAQLEARVRERTEELRVINSELEAFHLFVSHDLRAPLRHITGFATLLEQQSGESLNPDGRRYLTTITDAAGRMAKLH